MKSGIPSTTMILDNLRVMRRQETEVYATPANPLMASPATTSPESPKELLDPSIIFVWRRQMTDWCNSLANVCKMDLSTVEIAMSMVDRYSASQPSLVQHPYKYQLACVTALYTAAKFNEPKCFSAEQMQYLSRGQYQSSEIERLEQEMLPAVQWRVNPPTATVYSRYLLELLPSKLLPCLESAVDDVADQIRLAMPDPAFYSVAPSFLALASVLNVLENSMVSHSMLRQCKTLFFNALLLHDQQDVWSTVQIQSRLQSLVNARLGLDSIQTTTRSSMDSKHSQEDLGVANNSKAPHSPSAGSPRGVADPHRHVTVIL